MLKANRTFIIIATVVACGFALLWHGRVRQAVAVPQEHRPFTEASQIRSSAGLLRSVPVQLTETQDVVAVDFDWRQTLTNHVSPPKLPRDEVEKYLAHNHRNAESLLAASRALDDVEYLREAATNFPNDPHVQWSVLAKNLFPEDKRKWLDFFKASASDNSAANYLSARDYFEQGQTELAVKDLLAASRKPGFENYAIESKLAEEELGMSAGRSSIQARLSSGGWAQELQFSNFKVLAHDIEHLETQYLNDGDVGSMQQIAGIGVGLANRLETGGNDRFVITQLVGSAIEHIVLAQLNQDAAYEFLDGQTPTVRFAELKEQKNAMNTLRQGLIEAIPDMSEAELMSYFERQRIYGELEAMRWLQGRLSK